MKTKDGKVRTEFLVISGDEIKRIYEEGLGGITFKAEVHHSRIVLTAWTGENEKVSSVQVR